MVAKISLKQLFGGYRCNKSEPQTKVFTAGANRSKPKLVLSRIFNMFQGYTVWDAADLYARIFRFKSIVIWDYFTKSGLRIDLNHRNLILWYIAIFISTFVCGFILTTLLILRHMSSTQTQTEVPKLLLAIYGLAASASLVIIAHLFEKRSSGNDFAYGLNQLFGFYNDIHQSKL